MTENKYARRVQGLLANAADPSLDQATRDSYLKKARVLMEEHRIEEAMLHQTQTEDQRRGDIETREFRLEDHYEYMGEQVSVMRTVFLTTGCKVQQRWNGVEVVGYRRDLELAELLWFNIQTDYITKLFPSWNGTLTKDRNIFILKSAGYSWMDIVLMSPSDAGLNKNSGSYMRNAFKRGAASLGIESVAHSRTPAKYRATFSESYASRICQRLREMMSESRKAATSGSDDSKAVAIIRDEDFLTEEFYRRFPHMRPATDEERKKWREKDEERREKERERRAKLTDKQRAAEDAKREREEERWRRKVERESARKQPDALGWRNGYEAANSVNLTPGQEQFKKKEQING